MATKILKFSHRVGTGGGVLTNATSVYLSDPTGTFGVKRDDTDGVVVADGTAMTLDTTGVYTYSFTEPADGLTYTYWVEWTYGGLTHRAEFSTSGSTSVSDVTGHYADGSDLEDLFGRENIAKWSQLDNDVSTADATRIASALAYADGEIDLFFRGGPYSVPLSPIDSTCTHWAAVIAGVWLYTNRGQRDEGGEGSNQYTRMLGDVMNQMAKVKGGQLRGPYGKPWSTMPQAPTVVM